MSAATPFLPGLEVRVSSLLQAGQMVVDARRFYVRHITEFFLLASGATWHVTRARCPTWDDATECRCMLGEEA